MIDQLLKLPGIVQILFALLLGLILFFIFRFLCTGIVLHYLQSRAVDTLKEINASSQGTSIDPNRVAKEVMTHSTLSHLWSEFSKTLRQQKEVDE